MAASSEPLFQVRYAAQMGPWPCDPSGNSTVPVRDRIQVNRVIRSLDTILQTDTHMTHLVQALRERCEPSELHKLLQACCASIPWAKNDVLAPEAAVQQCPVPVLWEYGQPYNTNWGPPPYPHSPVHRPPLQAYQSKGAPPGQPDAQATSAKGPGPHTPIGGGGVHLAHRHVHECSTPTRGPRGHQAGPATDSQLRQPGSDTAYVESGVEAGDTSADPERLRAPSR